MFTSLAALALTGLLSLGADARPIPHTVRLYRRAEIQRRGIVDYETDRQPPKEWALEHNEPYRAYHFRYLQVGCHHMHDTDFFARCCSPRISYQTDADYPYECSVAAHVTGVSEKKVNKQLKVANAEASEHRHLEIVSVSSASIASKESIKASKASVISASSAAIESKHASKSSMKAAKASKSAASESSEAAAAKSSKQADKSSKLAAQSSKLAEAQSSKQAEKTSEAPKPTSTEEPTTTEEKPKPTPSPEPEEPTTTEEKPKPTPKPEPEDDGSDDSDDSGNGGGISNMFGAQFGTPSTATWFLQAGTIGACGLQSSPISDQEKVAALRYDFYDASKCGQMLRVTNTDNGKSVDVMFNDMCMGCKTETSVDLSPGAYEQIGSFEAGELNIEWQWL